MLYFRRKSSWRGKFVVTMAAVAEVAFLASIPVTIEPMFLVRLAP